MRTLGGIVGALALASVCGRAARIAGAGDAPARDHASLATLPSRPIARVPAELTFAVTDTSGRRVRFLQLVHERPMHVIVVSRDLAEFAHIHPEPTLDDRYAVTHTFAHGGRYRVFADYTPPGSGTLVDAFDVDVAGPARDEIPPAADAVLERSVDSLTMSLAFERPPVAGEDVRWRVSLRGGGRPVTDLQLYLGALAHVMVVSADLHTFIHAHPQELGDVVDTTRGAHVHDPAQLARALRGPSPATLHVVTSFPHAGLYGLWVQVQRHGRVITAPFVISVGAAPAAARPAAAPAPPRDAIAIVADASGFTPARVEVPRGRRTLLAFTRPAPGNCVDRVVIPALGITRALPVGGTVEIALAPADSADIPFQCGIGMFRGLIVVR
ncbi:MAG TPA: cupredoxin domain-containing protein [Candidatus Eisenbacteria bacterium]|nr:cupredoxin domain-containing protein [Candidatus Eisenbacteria bacterium]